MHRSETRDLTCCADCGADLDPGRERACGFGTGAFLCYACAIRRGGRYDEIHDRWLDAPDTGDLDAGED